MIYFILLPLAVIPGFGEEQNLEYTFISSIKQFMEGQMSEQSIFQVNNHHNDSAGRPPHLDDTTPNQYRGYFENEYGEQAIFIYDRTTSRGKLYMGDSGWETPYEIRDGEIVGLNLSPLEQSWLQLCWQAATWSKH